MTNDFRAVIDVTGSNLPGVRIPPGVGVALYVTGDKGVPATSEQLAAHPDALRIAQWPVLSVDEAAHADIIDTESNAATLADLVPWYRNAADSFDHVVRPGQRWPCTYMSQDRVDVVTATYQRAGITSGPVLWRAWWDLPIFVAIELLVADGDQYPTVGIQLHSTDRYDLSLFRTSWLNRRSAKPEPVKHGYLVTADGPAGPWTGRPVSSSDGGLLYG